MAETICIRGSALRALAFALLGMLGEEADRLSDAVSAADSEIDSERARAAFEALRSAGELLHLLDWRPGAAEHASLDVERELPVALEALERELECMEEVAADTQRAHDSLDPAQRLKETHEALRELEAAQRAPR